MATNVDHMPEIAETPIPGPGDSVSVTGAQVAVQEAEAPPEGEEAELALQPMGVFAPTPLPTVDEAAAVKEAPPTTDSTPKEVKEQLPGIDEATETSPSLIVPMTDDFEERIAVVSAPIWILRIL